jgi:tetratricopeptide (TPR) repeat protein
MRRICASLLLLAMLVPATAAANAEGPGSRAASGGTGKIPDSQFEALRAAGFDSIYNLDYATARAKFEEMVKLDPQHPAGYFYLATYQWLTVLDSMRRLTIGLYNRDSFYAGKEDVVDPKLDRQFRDAILKAIEVAQARVSKDAKDTEGLYYLGAAYGMRASYAASVARKWPDAIKDGRRGVEYHRKVIELDPKYADAYLSIGLYTYIVGTLPMFVKLFLAIGGVRGDRKRGIEEMKTAIAKGRYVGDDARIMLIAIYEREGNYAEALKLLEQLAAKYPNNYLFDLERASALAETGRHAESYAAFDRLLASDRAQVVADLIRYEYGEALSDGREFVRAAEQFGAVSKNPRATAALVSQAHLRRGMVLDAAGEREQALAQYQIVLKRPNVFDSHSKAAKYAKKPYAPPRVSAPPQAKN